MSLRAAVAGSSAGKALALGALAAVAAAAALDARSATASAIREGAPTALLVRSRAAGVSDKNPPDLVLLLYRPAEKTLDIDAIDPSYPVRVEGDSVATVYARDYARTRDRSSAGCAAAEAAAAALAREARWPTETRVLHLERQSPWAPDPATLKSRLVAWIGSPWFWTGAPSILRAHRAAGLDHAYDSLVLLSALRRIDPGHVRPARVSSLGGLPPAFEDPAAVAHRTVEILNASDSLGVALKATKVLRWRGIDVVHFGNAPRRGAVTRFIDHVGDRAAAKAAAGALGCPEPEVVTEFEQSPRATLTILLGRDIHDCRRLQM